MYIFCTNQDTSDATSSPSIETLTHCQGQFSTGLGSYTLALNSFHRLLHSLPHVDMFV